MLVVDILNSCTHGHVAEAAVASIGGDFAERVSFSARAQGQSVGEFTAQSVRRFSSRATERDWRHLAGRMRGEDLALLTGLEVVMTRMMRDVGALNREHGLDTGSASTEVPAALSH